MEAEDFVFSLFDINWFQTLILRRVRLPPPASSSTAIAVDPIFAESVSSDPSVSPPHSTLLLRRHRRSQSDGLAPSTALQTQSPKLRTIFSGMVEAGDPHRFALPVAESRERRFRRDMVLRGMKPRVKEGESKSLSDLEFEELKGFIDLGFTFPDAEAADPRLISIVPGLQRLREGGSDGRDSAEDTSSSASDVVEIGAVARAPYLSEAWEAAEAEEESCNALLKNWRVPDASEGIDMKDHLRLWAHTVASAVR